MPAGYQAVQRSAADAQVEQLRAVATEYLQAIADGEAERATELVPIAGSSEAAPASVLAAAEKIAQPEVDLVRIEGDTCSVQVRFQLDSRESVHLLGAERVDGEWRLTTSLAEIPRVELYAGYGGPQIAGIGLGRPAPLQLYPGAYTLDVVTDATTQIGGDRFVVDGDPATLTLIPTTVQTSPLLVETASEIALAHAEQCRSSGACDWPASASLSADAEPQVGNLASTGYVELVVPIGATSGSFNQAPQADPVPCGP